VRRFAELVTALDATTRTSAKVAALERYIGDALAEDAAWALHLLSGG
jgi:DNA ligase-1